MNKVILFTYVNAKYLFSYVYTLCMYILQIYPNPKCDIQDHGFHFMYNYNFDSLLHDWNGFIE